MLPLTLTFHPSPVFDVYNKYGSFVVCTRTMVDQLHDNVTYVFQYDRHTITRRIKNRMIRENNKWLAINEFIAAHNNLLICVKVSAHTIEIFNKKGVRHIYEFGATYENVAYDSVAWAKLLAKSKEITYTMVASWAPEYARVFMKCSTFVNSWPIRPSEELEKKFDDMYADYIMSDVNLIVKCLGRLEITTIRKAFALMRAKLIVMLPRVLCLDLRRMIAFMVFAI